MQKLAVVVVAAARVVVQVAVVLVQKVVVVAEVTALVLPNQPGVAQQQLRLLRLPSQCLAQGLEAGGVRPQVR
jgi:hypothetical protein